MTNTDDTTAPREVKLKVWTTCQNCKQEIDLNEQSFAEIHHPAQGQVIYCHWPLCIFQFAAKIINKKVKS